MNTNDRIKALRKQKQLSQDELARLTGYTDRSSIAKIEAGQVELTESKILSFARALEVSPSYLMGISDAVPIPSPVMELSHDEKQLVTDYRALNEEGKTAVRAAVSGFVSMEIYKKRDDSTVTLGA